MRLKDVHVGQTLVLHRAGEWTPRQRLPAPGALCEAQVHYISTPEETRANGDLERHVHMRLADGSVHACSCRQLIGTPQQYALLVEMHAREEGAWKAAHARLLTELPRRHRGIAAKGRWFPGAPPGDVQLQLTMRDQIARVLMALGLAERDAAGDRTALLIAAQRQDLPVRARRQRGLVTEVIIDGAPAVIRALRAL